MADLKNIQLTRSLYDEIIPSSNKKIKIRPFNVGDEKLLLIASESQEVVQMAQALTDVVSNCIEGANINELESYDFEYLFLKIRSVSVGETSEIGIQCQNCATSNLVPINMSDIHVSNIKENNKIVKFDSNLAFEMKVPSLQESSTLDASDVDSIFKMIVLCVNKVFYGEETIDIDDSNIKDLENIINQLSSTQFLLLRDFYESIPKVSKNINFVCGNCNEENNLKLEGLASFF